MSGGDVDHSSLLAFRKDTGEPAWQAGNDKASYSSPTLATLAKVRQLLSVNAGSVSAHDPATGKVLWEHSWPGEFAKCSQPVPLPPDRLFISAGYGIGCALLRIEHDKTWNVTEVWKNKNLKTMFTNAVVRDGFAYGLDDGILVCLDLATGAKMEGRPLRARAGAPRGRSVAGAGRGGRCGPRRGQSGRPPRTDALPGPEGEDME